MESQKKYIFNISVTEPIKSNYLKLQLQSFYLILLKTN